MYFRSKKKFAQDVFISDSIDSDNEGHSLTFMDVMSQEDTMLEEVDLMINSEKLHKFIGTVLDSREKEIVIMRYGLLGHHGLTQREVASKLGISRSYVSRIEKKALEKLKVEFDKGQ